MFYNDSEILFAIRSGNDKEALRYLYNTLFPKVKKYICENSGNSDVAFDIFQDGILVFYKYVIHDKFNPNYEINGFIYTVCKNLWLNQVKREKRMVTIPDNFDYTDEYGDIFEFITQKERENEVSIILTQLGKKCEELLRYSIFYKLRNSEICQKMGFSTENAVKTRKYKCLQKLISLIETTPSLKKMVKEL